MPTREEEIRECEEVVAWAQRQPEDAAGRARVRERLGRLLRENSYARERHGAQSESFGTALTEERRPYISNHTGYSRPGSENFEHDNTGSQMNLSGVDDDVTNAMIEHEGWRPGEDFEDKRSS